MRSYLSRFAVRLATLVAALVIWAPAVAHADWTTYRGDAARSGVDSSSVGSLPFAPAWTSPNLGGAVWGQPLVHDGLVVVGTESDQVVALSELTGQVVWQASAGTPVQSNQLRCGDISPTVGITSTPVIDPATNRVFVVADTTSSGTIRHKLFAFDLSTGAAVAGFPVDAEPPGDVPADQLQRPGLALDNGRIIIGYGGNDGDCGTYHGWLVSVPESGGAESTFEVEPTGTEGAIWGAGNAPPIDSAGNVWASTGNGNSGSTFGDQESVLKLDLNVRLLDHWAPSTWQTLDNTDADLGSSAPLLLPNGLVFQIGKQGIGYLLSSSNLGGTGASPLFQASVCGGSWGGAIYYSGIIYVTCSSGLRALALNATAPSFAPVTGWRVTSAVNGPPMVAGGLVWATDFTHGTLYGLNLQSGVPAVTQSTPAMEHFSTPSASDGKLFLATGDTVEAYTIANPAPAAPPTSTPPPASGPGTTPTPTTSASPPPTRCVLKLRNGRVKIHHPKRTKAEKHTPPAYGTVALVAKCDQSVPIVVSGIVTERVGEKTRTVHLPKARLTLKAGATRVLQMRISPGLLQALEKRIRESGSFTLTAVSAGGTSRVTARGRLRL